jgi:hypothetical protein
VADSILGSTKKMLGLGDVSDEFDVDLIMHINSVFSTLNQIGIGPPEGFSIEDDSVEWVDYLADDKNLNSIKSYMYLKVRLIFDPPTTSFHLAAIKEQIEQFEWRLSVKREGESWTPPVSTPPVDPEVVIVPSSQAWYSE